MRKNFTLLFFMWFAITANAAPISVKQAKNAATNFLMQNFGQTKSAIDDLTLVWSDTETMKSGDVQPTFYVFNTTGSNGFIVIAGDDEAYPVLGYSTQQSFRTENMPANLKAWFESYQKQIHWLRETRPAVPAEISEAWAALNKGSLVFKSTGVQLTTALWDQIAPYNDLCPTLNGIHTYTGCVATATSIVMRYHKWPATGQGGFSYTTTTNNLSVSANFDTNFDWDNMPMQYVAGQYTAQQAQNVATLMFDCGVFAQMDYDTTNSGALTINAAQGLVNYMQYDKSLRLLSRDNYQTIEWVQLLNNEINNNRPVMYGGENSLKEGHQFILDGYTEDNYYHINWGWSGLANGFYLLDAFNPEVQGTGGNSGGGFSIGQDALIGIQKPQAGSTYQDVLCYFSDENNGTTYNGISTSVASINPNTDFNVTAGAIGNNSIREFNGLIAIALTDSSGNIKQIISPQESVSIAINYGTIETFSCTITTSIAPSDKIRGIYKSSDSDTWQWIRGGGNTIGEISISNPTSNEAISHTPDIQASYTPSGYIEVTSSDDIKAVSLYDICGRLLHKTRTDSGYFMSLPATQYAKGVYLVEVSTTTGKGVRKVSIR